LIPLESKTGGDFKIARAAEGWRDMAGTSDRRKGLVARTWSSNGREKRQGYRTVFLEELCD
jgi:hypothetical protein